MVEKKGMWRCPGSGKGCQDGKKRPVPTMQPKKGGGDNRLKRVTKEKWNRLGADVYEDGNSRWELRGMPRSRCEKRRGGRVENVGGTSRYFKNFRGGGHVCPEGQQPGQFGSPRS